MSAQKVAWKTAASIELPPWLPEQVGVVWPKHQLLQIRTPFEAQSRVSPELAEVNVHGKVLHTVKKEVTWPL